MAGGARFLAWLGRRGPLALSSLVFLGIALPPLGRLLKPLVSEAVFILLCLAFLQVDARAMRGHLKKPALVAGSAIFSAVLLPAIFGTAGLLMGLDRTAPELYLGLVVQAAASPMMASPALAAIMGLDSTLVLASMAASSLLLPLTAPVFAQVFLGGALTISPLALAGKLTAMLFGSALLGLGLRRVLGSAWVHGHREALNGCNLLALFVFVASVMGGLGSFFLADPLSALTMTALAFLVFGLLLALTTLAFWRAGPAKALALGLMASQRNLGIMLATAGASLPEAVWVYFAASQFPIYLSPQLLRPLASRLLHRKDGGGRMKK